MNTSSPNFYRRSGSIRPPGKLALLLTISLFMVLTGALLAQDHDVDMQQGVQDARYETQINTTYTLSPYLRAHDIDVTSVDGKVTLTGIVEDQVVKELAREIAMGVDGVTAVDNQIEVQADFVVPQRDVSERGFADKVNDAYITAAITSKLLWSRYAEGFNTNVDTLNGKVTLRGSAESGAARELAAVLAADTDGVTGVDNQLVIEPRQAATVDAGPLGEAGTDSEPGALSRAGQSISDTWITTKVKSSFMMSRNVRGNDISVTTTDGVVTLVGKVDSGPQKELAIERASNIRGVVEVVSTDLDF